jgi:hypothetical protein
LPRSIHEEQNTRHGRDGDEEANPGFSNQNEDYDEMK